MRFAIFRGTMFPCCEKSIRERWINEVLRTEAASAGRTIVDSVALFSDVALSYSLVVFRRRYVGKETNAGQTPLALDTAEAICQIFPDGFWKASVSS